MGAARDHGIIVALTEHQIPAAADTAYQGAGRPSRSHKNAGARTPTPANPRKLSQNQKDVNTAHARRRGLSERTNVELKNWRVLRKIRSSPNTADKLIAAVQTLMIASA